MLFEECCSITSREGCVVSPLLFAIYINELTQELEEKGGDGVGVGSRRLRCLLFADDIVILDETPEGLQKSLDVAYKYSLKWRFKFNCGKDKSAVIVFGRKKKGLKWSLGDSALDIVDNYKYLGVRLRGMGGWKLWREEMIRKARGGWYRAWGLGVGSGVLSPAGGSELWSMLARSVLEYGSELDSEKWEEAERLQRLAGRMVLGVGKGVADEVVLGDLGWWTVQGRREYLRLVYWGKIVREGKLKDGIVSAVYKEGRRRVIDGRAGPKEWCVGVRTILDRIGLGEYWVSEDVMEEAEWKRMVRVMMHEYEQFQWKERMCGGGRGLMGKIKLGHYIRIKTRLKKEWFLREHRQVVRRWVQLRSGVEDLEVERGRRTRMRREDRLCRCCNLNKVEDVSHFLIECTCWSGRRKTMWSQMEEENSLWRIKARRARMLGSREKVDWILSGGRGGVTMGRMVMCNVVGMLFERDKVRRKEKRGLDRKAVIEGRKRKRERKLEEMAEKAVKESIEILEKKWVQEFTPIITAHIDAIFEERKRNRKRRRITSRKEGKGGGGRRERI